LLLKIAHLLVALLAISHGSGRVPVSGAFKFLTPDVLLKFESEKHFLPLRDGIWENTFQNFATGIAAHGPSVRLLLVPVLQVSSVDYAETEVLLGEEKRLEIGVNHNAVDVVENRIVLLAASVDTNAALSVNESSEVGIEQFISHLASNGMVTNSENTRCPARRGAEGQPRTKQSAETSMGVRNEQVSPPKGKICSELAGNREKSAETTDSYWMFNHSLNIPCMVTDCHLCTDGSLRPTFIISDNTVYESYQFNAGVHYRATEAKDMDLGFEHINYKGVPWVWDRDCPAGCQYFIEDIDPWTGDVYSAAA
jgi:hypothetical protein